MAVYIETQALGCVRAVKLIVGIFHTELGKHRLKATLVKWPVVGHKWQTLNQRLYLRPYFRKYRLSVSVASGQSMHLGGPVCIIIGRRLYETVEFGKATSDFTLAVTPANAFFTISAVI